MKSALQTGCVAGKGMKTNMTLPYIMCMFMMGLKRGKGGCIHFHCSKIVEWLYHIIWNTEETQDQEKLASNGNAD
jgi:hypothetical protein